MVQNTHASRKVIPVLLGCPNKLFQPIWSRLAPGFRQVRRDQMELNPTEPDTGRIWFLLSSECDRSR